MDPSNHLNIEENQSCQASLEIAQLSCCPCDHEDDSLTEETCCSGEMDMEEDMLDSSLNEENSPEGLNEENSPKEALIENSSEPSKKKGHQKFPEDELNEVREKIKNIPNPDDRITFITEQMEAALSQGGTPHFKVFWELRKICLDSFKENISPTLRQTAWGKYRELSKEARKLKELFDEQSAFAVEQIEIAIKALEQDIQSMNEFQEKMEPLVFEHPSKFYDDKREYYDPIQKKLNLLNAYAARINNLRKELIRTEMRIKHKNKFFQRLSQAGDKIFPERKQLIKEISEQFIKDINGFVDAHFKEGAHEPSFVLREEIKSLQGIAKALTLNTSAFTETRTRLSECWDKLKNADKERKKERAKKRDAIKSNYDEVIQKITETEALFNESQLNPDAFMANLDEISSSMRHMELGREEIKELKDRLTKAKKPALTLLKQREEDKQKAEKEKAEKRLQAILNLQQSVDEFIKKAEALSLDEIRQSEQQITSSIQESGLSTKDQNDLIKKMKGLKDIISEKEEEALLAMTDDDKNALNTLKEVLEQRNKRRNEITEQLKKLRKAAGSSGLDFEKAMEQQIQINEGKERLEKADQGIEEIEEKLNALKKKIRNSKSA
ncbi:hypothetical protein [Criblamydia sequanensis]|uniref:Myosin heavy chain n=1 Tax=Candidatus Criblamydia sequanensis CRIB-18 TaxID=1437425 RepID=A0A090D1J0_9BACT|nr:hypothetical protein [Criblamydia sequanensis]CDR33573.1 Conserved hypothetical protein [Criblamydia sequanensis CRIB-18]